MLLREVPAVSWCKKFVRMTLLKFVCTHFTQVISGRMSKGIRLLLSFFRARPPRTKRGFNSQTARDSPLPSLRAVGRTTLGGPINDFNSASLWVGFTRRTQSPGYSIQAPREVADELKTEIYKEFQGDGHNQGLRIDRDVILCFRDHFPSAMGCLEEGLHCACDV